MAGTQVSPTSQLRDTVRSVALFAVAQKHRTFANIMTGPAPSQSDAGRKLAAQSGMRDVEQTSPDYPIVTVNDLTSAAGDAVTVDLFHEIGGKPIMGDRIGEGKGEKLTSSTMEIKIDDTSKVVDAGGKMSQKRTKVKLKNIALKNLANWFGRHKDQITMVHAAGARGFEVGDWVVPLASDEDFGEIVVNQVKAPTFNRHFVASGLNLVQGGKQLEAIASTDFLALEHIDDLSTMLAEDGPRMQPIKIMDDPAAEDNPLYLMLVSYRAWNQLMKKTTGNNWRTFMSNAFQRASYGSKHPLFKGEAGMWGNILVKRMSRNVRFKAGDPFQYVAQANRYTGAETASTINAALTAGVTVDRCLVLGGQAIAHVYGEMRQDGKSTGSNGAFYERKYNFEKASEFMGSVMGGCAKLRFDYLDDNGRREPTDHGVVVFDVASAPVSTITSA